MYVEAGYPWLGPDAEAMGLVVDVYFRCCQNITAARNTESRPRGMPTASPMVAAGLEQDTWAVVLELELDSWALVVEDAEGVAVVVTVVVPWLAAAEDGVKGVPALKVKFVWHMSIVNSPLPEQVKKPLPLAPGHRLMLLNAPLFTSLQFCGHSTALNVESVQPPRYMTPALP
jgi:hypothetical protein